MPVGPINVAIVDDHSLFRKTLKSFLSEYPPIHVSVMAADIFDLFSKLKISSIDVLLMDIFMPGLNGNDALRTIRAQHPAIKILVLSVTTDTSLIGEMLNEGIHGFVSKADEPEEILQAIESAADNRIFRNMHFTEALYSSNQNKIMSYIDGTDIVLNDREKRIIQLIWEEKTNKEIASELFLGVRSVEKLRQDIKEKISAKSTVGLLKYGIDKKIIDVNTRLLRPRFS